MGSDEGSGSANPHRATATTPSAAATSSSDRADVPGAPRMRDGDDATRLLIGGSGRREISPRKRRRLSGAEPLDAVEHPLRVVSRRAAIERIGNQAAGARDIAGLKGRHPLVQDRFGLPLQLGLRVASAVDVGARPIVMPIEEQHARPEVDGRFVVTEEILIEPGEQQLLDAGVALRLGQRVGRVRVGTKRGVVSSQVPALPIPVRLRRMAGSRGDYSS